MRVRGSRDPVPSATACLQAAASLALLAACMACRAQEPAAAQGTTERVISALTPSGAFAQVGIADEVTAATGGAIWSLVNDRSSDRWSVSLEGSISRWQSRRRTPSDHGVLTQIALVPVVRHRFDQGRSPWFVEGGIGATVTSSVYRHADKHFSTAFNFGTHVGVGYAFGAARRHEVGLRVEHFSNAGIKHPNPGENFLQLRYVRLF